MLKRRLLRILLLLAAAVLVCGIAAPWLAGTELARGFVADLIGEALGREVALFELEAGWTSALRLGRIEVKNASGEFGGGPMLKVRSVRVDRTLYELIFGGAGETAVVVDGLDILLEERAGGRTNVDDILERLARPVERPTEPRPPAAIRLSLRDCNLTLRRLPRRPQPRPVDPFAEDPVILPADAHAFEIGIAALDLDVALKDGTTRLDFRGGVTVDGRGGRVEGSLFHDGARFSGEIAARGVDLAVLRQPLEGSLDLTVRGDASAFEVSARVVGFRIGDTEEEWVELKAKCAEGPEVEALTLATASGDYALEGSGSLDHYRAGGRAQLRERSLRFDVTGSGTDLTGTAALDEIAARFDIGLDPETRLLTIRSLTATADEIDVTAAGTATLREPFVCDLSCDATVDLERVRPYVPEDFALQGRVRLERFRLRLDADGNVVLRGSAEVTDFVAARFKSKRSHLEIDAVVQEGGDVVRIARGRFDDLTVSGHLAGLREGRLREADGTIRGTLPLRPLPGLEEIQELDGTLFVDLTASTGDAGVRVKGEAVATDLRLEGFDIRTRQRRVRVTADLLGRDGAWSGSASAGADDIEGTLTDATFDGDAFAGRIRFRTTECRHLKHPAVAEKLRYGGDLSGDVSVSRSGGTWTAEGRVASRRLTLLWDGEGLRNEAVSITGKMATPISGAAVVTLPGRDVTIDVKEFTREHVVLEARGALDSFPQLKGRATLDATLGVDRFDAVLTARDFVGGGVPSRTARLEAKGTFAAGVVDITSFDLVLDKGRATGKATLADVIRFDVVASGDHLGALTGILLTDVTAAGPFRVRAEGVWPRGDGDAEMRGDYEITRLETAGVNQGRSKAEFSGTATIEGGRITDLHTTVAGRIATLRSGSIRATGVEINQTGSGNPDGRGFLFRTTVRADRVLVDGLPFETVVVSARGRLEGAGHDLVAQGTLGFARAVNEAMTWTAGAARFDLAGDVVTLSDIEATCNGGTVTGSGVADLGVEPLPWRAKLKTSEVRLSESLGRPLSFLVPVLRLKRGRASLEGTLSCDLALQGRGTSIQQLSRSLRGGGEVSLRNVTARGSLLLPLLSPSIKGLLGRPYRFRNLDIAFRVSKGRVFPDPFQLLGEPFSIRIEGSAGLDGTLDFLMRPQVLRIPLRLKGTFDRPKVRPAPLELFR